LDIVEGEERYALDQLSREYANSELLTLDVLPRERLLHFARTWVDFAQINGGSRHDSFKTFHRLEENWDNLFATASLLWDWCVHSTKEQNSGTQSASITDRDSARLLIDLATALDHFLWFSGRWGASVTTNTRAAAAARAIEDPRGEARCSLQAAWILYNRGETGEAMEHTKYALQVWTNHGTRLDRAFGDRMIGLLNEQSKNFVAAKEKFESALMACRITGTRGHEAFVLNDLGRLAHVQGEHVAAKDHYMEGLHIARELADVHGQAELTCGLAKLALDQGEFVEAARLLEEGMLLGDEVGRQDLTASIKWQLARLYHAQGLHEEALAIGTEAQAIFSRLSHREQAEIDTFLNQVAQTPTPADPTRPSARPR
jgi:tetratricopeptide (TPR) repeat protein